jgi:signal transduction histidine kinase
VGSKTRRLLAGSLGGLVLLTVATGATAFVLFERFASRQQALQARVLARRQALERTANAILLSGTLARDYFLAPDDPAAPVLRSRIRGLQEQSARDLAPFPQSPSLKGEIGAYWRVLDLMSDMAGSGRRAGVDEYFRHQLAQRRETMLRIADSVGAELDRESRAGEAELERLRDHFRNVLGIELGMVMALGLIVSWGTLRKVTALESQARALSAQVVRAQEEERTAIARELHDEIGQSLSGLLLELGSASRTEATAEMRGRLQAIACTAERAVDSVRQLSLDLRPSMLDDLGLLAALEWQAREVGRRSGLDVQVEADDGAGEVPGEQSTCIYRVAQEALRNCARHSGAKHVRVGLARGERTVRLEISDDGQGFRAARTRGLGLLGMEERVALAGGHLRVESEPGKGTRVLAELPV